MTKRRDLADVGRYVAAYSVTYEPQILNAEAGWWFNIYVEGRLLVQGWCKGSRADAEAEARRCMAERDDGGKE